MIILGAGLAGLSAAYHLEESLIYEQSTHVGGRARSICRDGFTFDQGIHVLHSKNKYVLDLLHLLNADLEEREREAWIYHYETFTRYPFQANTYGLPIDIVKACLLGFIANDFPRDQINTYHDWLYHQYGQGISDLLMTPYSLKFWGVHPRDMTTEWVSVRHPRPTLDEVITGAITDQEKGFGVNAKFRYPRQGGFGAIPNAFADSIGRDHIQLGMRATRIDVNQKVIEFNDGEHTAQYDTLISTIPLPDLVELLTNAPESLRQAASLLRTNSVLVVNLGIDVPNLTEKHWIYFPEDDYIFFRISFPMNKAMNMVPPGKSSILAEISYGNGQMVDRKTIEEQVVSDLCRSGVLRDEKDVIFSDLHDIPYAYIIYDQNRKPAVRTIHDYLKKHDLYPCGRYGQWGYLWSDEAILSGRRAALSVRKKMEAEP